MIRYARCPSPSFISHLAPGGLLYPMLERRTVHSLPLDVQLREYDHLHVYCGLTLLVDASLAGGRLRVSAHETYSSQACGAPLFRTWSADETGFAAALDHYLANVKVSARHLLREGAVQAAWARISGPWTPFDREAVLGYGDSTAQTAGRTFPAVAAARAELQRVRPPGRWAPIRDGKVSAELDQLAVDPDGRLVLIELKYARAPGASVYYAPLQLLQYIHEWAAAFDAVRDQLIALSAARKAIGLSPLEMPDIVGGLRPVIGFGVDSRSNKVRTRFEAVREVANRYLPVGVAPIEVWALEGAVPVRIG